LWQEEVKEKAIQTIMAKEWVQEKSHM